MGELNLLLTPGTI